MSQHGTSTVLVILLTLAILASLPATTKLLPPKASAATITLALQGDAISGWNGTTNADPDITVNFGDTVTIKLTSIDGMTHRFWLDSNNDTVAECGTEPCSNNILPSSPQIFTFTTGYTAGTYQYYCIFHPLYMVGNFIIRAVHDAAISGLATSRSSAYNSVTTANPVKVNVTAKNNGQVGDSFAVWAQANNTLIGNITITLAAGATRIITFNWTNTQTLQRGNYILSANATKITSDANLINNQYIAGVFIVKLKGDVSGDCKVDIVDLATVGSTFGKTTGTPGFNTNADLNNDGTINIVDLVLVAGSFGQTCP